jgi:hypothetical protein
VFTINSMIGFDVFSLIMLMTMNIRTCEDLTSDYVLLWTLNGVPGFKLLHIDLGSEIRKTKISRCETAQSSDYI